MNRTNSMNPLNGNLDRSLSGFLRDVENSVELQMRLIIVFLIASIIFLPDMVALLILLIDVFSENPVNEPMSAVFKGIVVSIIFVFGVSIVAWASHQQRWLRYSLPILGFCLVLVAAGLLTITSNRCIPDLQCSQSKFWLAMGVVTALSAFAFLLTRPEQKAAFVLGLPYLAIASWQSFRLIFTIISIDNITPGYNYVEGLALFVYSIIWIFIYFIGSQERPVEE